MQGNLYLSVADEEEFNDVIVGKPPAYPIPWRPGNVRLSAGRVGILWGELQTSHISRVARPYALILHKEDRRRLFGRISQVRDELSPLSSWCHILDPQSFLALDGPYRQASLDGLEASWAGLIIAEATLLASRSTSALKLAACMATSSFAVGRAKAIWGSKRLSEITERYDRARNMFGLSDAASSRYRESFQRIWAVLDQVSGSESYPSRELLPLVNALKALRSARENDFSDEAIGFFEALTSVVPELVTFSDLQRFSPEERVGLFDRLVSLINSSNNQDTVRDVYALVAGYISTIAAGGSPSLSLVEEVANEHPDLLAWAYVIGGIGERIVWSSAFDGLGRLVTRELMRGLHIEEPPHCDFSFDEAEIVVDADLNDPFVHLRIKQSRTISVGIVCGVNVVVPLGDSAHPDARISQREEQRGARTPPPSNLVYDPVEVLADAIWPYLESKIFGAREERTREFIQAASSRKKAKAKKYTPYQPGLPLKKS